MKDKIQDTINKNFDQELKCMYSISDEIALKKVNEYKQIISDVRKYYSQNVLDEISY